MTETNETEMIEMTSNNTALWEIGYAQLNEDQKLIFTECIATKPSGGGLSLPVGSGKSVLSLTLGLYYQHNQYEETGLLIPFLVVASKTLVLNWVNEIKTFFGDKLEYQILHQEYCSLETLPLSPTVRIYLTTIEVTAKFYKLDRIHDAFRQNVIEYMNNLPVTTTHYERPTQPFYQTQLGANLIYSMKWSALFVDEVHIYTNIKSNRCQSIASICAQVRWGLSGTMFDEPKPEKILGFYMIIDKEGFPRSIPDCAKHIASKAFRGLKSDLVHRSTNNAFRPPPIFVQVIEHCLTPNEEAIYTRMKIVFVKIRKRIESAREIRNTEAARRFSSYLLSLITYMRQCMVCPLIPIARLSLDTSHFENRSVLSEMVMEEINSLHLGDYLNDVHSAKSSRISKCIEIIERHPNERILVFTSFRSCLQIFQSFLSPDRPHMTISSNMSATKRDQVQADFAATTNGILLLTYEIGGRGLNLQCASVVLITDLWWNSATTIQATGRLLRIGQMNPSIHIYYFSANTGIEKAVLEKQQQKMTILDNLACGSSAIKVKTMKISDIVLLIEQSEIKDLMEDVIEATTRLKI